MSSVMLFSVLIIIAALVSIVILYPFVSGMNALMMIFIIIVAVVIALKKVSDRNSMVRA